MTEFLLARMILTGKYEPKHCQQRLNAERSVVAATLFLIRMAAPTIARSPLALIINRSRWKLQKPPYFICE